MKKLLLLVLLGLSFPVLTLAEQVPPRGKYDPRIRVVDHNPLDIVKLSTFYGVSTHVQFADDEVIKDIAVGDDQAWKIVPRGNHLFIKPQDIKADTNVTVVTDQRTYHFSLVVHQRSLKDSTAWADPNLVFSLLFRYPDKVRSQQAAQEKIAALQATQSEIKDKLEKTKNTVFNSDYWVAGSEETSPTAAYDDGRFIYLVFNNNRDMPAVYSVDGRGNEALINTHVTEGNTLVIQRLVRHLMLRKGHAVSSLVNRSFDPNGGTNNITGTIASDVQRVVKETQ